MRFFLCIIEIILKSIKGLMRILNLIFIAQLVILRELPKRMKMNLMDLISMNLTIQTLD